ncbi:MAG: TonB-dependent receptor [Pseudomonadota bacterium]
MKRTHISLVLLSLGWGSVCWGLLTRAAQAQEAAGNQDVLVQTGRLAQKQFDAPASLRVVDGEAIRNAGAQVNLSEALAQTPGVVALNRNNYAQDLQISIRGFGSRAAFGLRGIRLITDGIPATTPDGQGQASTVSLTSADRIEVLTGPLAQLYGNASGGVIQTFTREAGALPQADVSTTFGSYGLQRHDVQLSGRMGQVGIVADYSRFEVDGYRQNSAAKRQQFNGVLTAQLQEDTRLKLVANLFDMPEAQDPLGLTAAQWLADPQQAGAGAVTNRTRKSVQQNQLGLVLEHQFHPDLHMQWRAYAGTRDNLQYQTNAKWVGLQRDFQGMGAQIKGKVRHVQSGALDWVVGGDVDRSAERRQGGNTVGGEKEGALTRDELNKAANTDAYAQANWHVIDAQGRQSYTLTAGVRRSQVQLENADDLPLTDGNGSGRVRYTATNPVLGLTWHALDTLNVYANWGRGFETPTLAEAAYSVENNVLKGVFNTGLLASRSQHMEVGAKWVPSPAARLDAALFRITTENEIVTLKSSYGKTAYKNAARTLREGAELSWQNEWSAHWRSQLSVAVLRALYDENFVSGTTLIAAGKRMPGIPEQQLYASLQWAEQGFASKAKPQQQGWSASADWMLRSALWGNDLNDSDARVSGQGVLNLRLRHRSLWGAVRAEGWLGVDNATDRAYVGSVIVNQSSKQYFEAGLPRNWMLGLKLSVPL